MDDLFFVDKTASSVENAYHDDQDDDSEQQTKSILKVSSRAQKRKNSDKALDEDELAALEEERRLESLVFDDPEDILDNIAHDNNNQDIPKSFSKSILDRLESNKSKNKKQTKQLQPVWVDDQDEELTVDLSKSKTKKLKRSVEETQIDVREYENRLRALKEKTVYQSLDWAQLSETNMNGTDILQTNKPFISKSSSLQPHQISFVKATDATAENPFKHSIKCVNFHPKSQLVLIASSEEKQFRLFNVDGAKNSQVQSVVMDKFPIRKAIFSPNGKEVFAISPSQHCYIYDIQSNTMRSISVNSNNRLKLMDIDVSPDNQFIAVTSSTGQLDLFSDKSKRRIHTFQPSGRIVASAFSPDSKTIYCASDDRSVYVFDVNAQRCTHKFVDEGSMGNTCLGFSHDGSLLALGSTSGVVNVYETKSIQDTSNPVPINTIMNLKTSVSKVMFNSTSEILAIHSSESTNGIRLVHTPSWSTFQNWPEKSRIRYTSFDISPNSGYICLGTPFGSAPLYRFLHFGSA